MPVSRLREAFLHMRPEFEVIASEDHLPDANAAWAWKDAHEQFVSSGDWSKSNPGKTVFVFWQDGPWAILMDMSYVMPSDEEKLTVLSGQVGTVLSLIVETTSGCTFFCCFENGRLRRMIDYAEGEVTTKGDPLPEEAGIDVDSFYMDESEALCKAFGLSSFDGMPGTQDLQAISVVDRTDYTDLHLQRQRDELGRSEVKPQKRPWWRFW
ncbi:MAG: hypothetical protein IH897_11495, partial [Planctomycetes bacterium]|nr:hypothetical protein [Planctomycetota bacterium]